MTPRRRLLAFLLPLILLAACVAPPRPVPERSPLAAPERNRRYMPIVIVDQFSLGKGAAVPYPVFGCQDAQAVGATWLYDWSLQPPICDGVLSVPMQWGAFNSKTCPALGPGRLAFGFNEPDRKDQANIAPERAAELWHKLTVECYPDRLWATPAICGTSGYTGLPWLAAWWDAYVAAYGAPPRADYLAVHCFTWSTAQSCIDRLTAYQAWGQAHGITELIVSEWAILPGAIGDAVALREAATLRQWLDSNPAIAGYAWTSTRIEGTEKWWFGPENNTGLVDFTTGKLTGYGTWYAR